MKASLPASSTSKVNKTPTIILTNRFIFASKKRHSVIITIGIAMTMDATSSELGLLNPSTVLKRFFTLPGTYSSK